MSSYAHRNSMHATTCSKRKAGMPLVVTRQLSFVLSSLRCQLNYCQRKHPRVQRRTIPPNSISCIRTICKQPMPHYTFDSDGHTKYSPQRTRLVVWLASNARHTTWRAKTLTSPLSCMLTHGTYAHLLKGKLRAVPQPSRSNARFPLIQT